MALSRRGCAPHSSDPDGPLYDGTGKVCPAISKDDIPVMIGAFGACGLILLILAAIGLRTLLRSRRNAARSRLGEEPLMSSISPMAFQGPTLQASSNLQGPSATLYSPAYQPEPSSPLISDGSHERSPALSSSESFHFPILSADGNLLPPMTTQGGQTLRSPSFFSTQRPLPFAPATASEADPYAATVEYSIPTYPGAAQYGLYEEDLASNYHRSFEAQGEDTSRRSPLV